jgi:hypothetical protein
VLRRIVRLEAYVTILNSNSIHIGLWRQVLGVKSSICLAVLSKKEAAAP